MSACYNLFMQVVENEKSTRNAVLISLKKHGRLTVKELADLLGMTLMGVRRHLAQLEHDGLVQHETAQRGMGRPSHVYRLSQRAQDLFPATYAQLTNELLSYIELLDGSEHVEAIFQRRGQRRIQQAQQRMQGKSTLAARVAELAAILDEDGYLADWQQVDDRIFVLREFNCAVHHVAQRFRQACGSEIEFIQAVLPDAVVERLHHILLGETFCGYRIVARQAENP